jgi:hypothetical protein
MEGVNLILAKMGLSQRHTQLLNLLLRWVSVQSMWRDVESTGNQKKLKHSDLQHIHYAVQQMAASVADAVAPAQGALLSSSQVQQMLQVLEGMTKYILEQQLSNKLTVPTINYRPVDYTTYPSFHSFVRQNVESLAGPAELAAIFRPVEFTLVPDKISDFVQFTEALMNADNLCTLLSYQTKQIRYTHILTVSLIQYLFTQVVPVPLAHNHPNIKQCMYRQPIRYEAQVNALRVMHHLCLHFAASSMSLRMNRVFDSARVLTVASMAAIADAIIRMRAYDIPSMLSLHLNGTAPPTPRYFFQPFGFDASAFRQQSEDLIFYTPDLITTRTRVLDYFTAQREIIKDDHLIFQFETTMLPGALTSLLDQLCWEIGFPTENLPLYITGEQTEILYNYPELEYYRDIAFMFKYLMTPDASALPEFKPWMQKDARLTWTYKEGEGKDYIDRSSF